MSKRLRVLALASYPIESASSRYRITQFIEPLAARGIDVTFSPFLGLVPLRRPVRAAPAAANACPAWSWLRSAASARSFGRTRGTSLFVQREAMLFGPPLVEWIAARASCAAR
jgi:hypothetical protein